MLPTDAKIISVDDHVLEHPRVWLDRLPAKYADIATRTARLPDGNDTWLYEGARSGNFALNAVAEAAVVGIPDEQWGQGIAATPSRTPPPASSSAARS
jgi:acyl-CoA synthetase (AMP-forming)/AMP-acid ligase II